MIGNITPEDMRKWKVSFSNFPSSLEPFELTALSPDVPGLKDIELTSAPSDRRWPTEPITMTVTETETVAGSAEMEHIRRWMELAKAPKEKPYSVYAVPGGAVIEYKWPCFKLKFRSLRLAQVFAKNYTVEWNMEQVETQ